MNMRTFIDVVEGAGGGMSPSFYQWFGNSKVVDARGNPLVVYHGGKTGIKIFGDNYRATIKWANESGFRLSEIARLTYENPLHFFTDDEGVADGYSDQHADPHIYECYLKIENPLDLRVGVSGRDAVSQALTDLLQSKYDFNSEYSDSDVSLTISHAVRMHHHTLPDRLRTMGHDGVIMPDTDVRDRGRHTSYVVFTSGQIKSVDSLSFDRASDDIWK